MAQTSQQTVPSSAYRGRSSKQMEHGGGDLLASAVVFTSSALLAAGAAFILPPFCFPDQSSNIVCLNPKSYLALFLTFVSLYLMARSAPADMVLLGATVVLLLFRVIDDEQAWLGFSSPSILAVGALFVVARALQETGAIHSVILPLFGRPTGAASALLRLCIPTCLMSAVMNNTPIVAMLIPACETLASTTGISVEALLMPLSFSSMLGGMCTLVGTSTNLVLNAQIASDPLPPCEPFTLFAMTPIALPATTLGIAYLVIVAPLLLIRQTPVIMPPASLLRTATEETLQLSASQETLPNGSPILKRRHSFSSTPFVQKHHSRDKQMIAGGALVLTLILSNLKVASLLHLALASGFATVACGCLTMQQALAAIDLRVLLTIASSFGMAAALEETHVSDLLGSFISAVEPHVGAIPFLFLLFLLTAVVSCIVSNAAAVVLLYSVVRDVHVESLRPTQTLLVLMLGASAAFATPIGYQTNMMVLKPGNYHFGDFTRLGGPLMLIIGFVVSTVAGFAPKELL
eukprot:CAMPEP_0119300174 /NCGR_PEP_ID=MMETSP1333-20130426/2171_1 /TAXON_ID=418940 /ORGANISM="Scyphosphaera apsteinii, Strain RCC1455" /LENGTH=518 /DNA_ID=CAMNT_0007301861 /DNA_START=211 /DNA_END=1768 /DNA_ORIENTATION=+